MTVLSAEQMRIAAILALPEAKGREASARVIALSTDKSVDDARAILLAIDPVPEATPTKRDLPRLGLSSLSAVGYDSPNQPDHGWSGIIEKINAEMAARSGRGPK
jgi:hypothetical protein